VKDVQEEKDKSKNKDKKKVSEEKGDPDAKEPEGKTIVVSTDALQSLVLDSVSDLLEKGVLAETEDGKKIDLKKNLEYEEEADEKKKKKEKREADNK
jgi:hypothetical protein